MLPVTISLTRYNEPDELFHESLLSLSRQKKVKAEVIVLDQQSSESTYRFCGSLNNPSLQFTYRVIDQVSLSYARTRAIEYCDTDVLLFIDADAAADSDWAFALGKVLQKEAAVAGGKIIPQWGKRPLWICRSRIIREQYSILDLGRKTFPTGRVLGANFGINLRMLGEQAYFDLNLGRKDGKLTSGEETDLCDRARKIGRRVYYCGSATVTHKIHPERMRYYWIWQRLLYAGKNRAMRGGFVNPLHEKLFWDYVMMPLIALPYSLGYFSQKKRIRQRSRKQIGKKPVVKKLL